MRLTKVPSFFFSSTHSPDVCFGEERQGEGQEMPLEHNSSADQNWWAVFCAWAVATSAAFFAIIRMARFLSAKVSRLLALPEQIEAMGEKATSEARKITEALSDKIELLDGRFKLGQQLIGAYAFIELDANGLATFVSSQASILLGRERDECLGTGWWSSLESVTTDRGYVRDRWMVAKQAGERFECDVCVINDWRRSRTNQRLRVIPIHRFSDHKLLGWKALLTKQDSETDVSTTV